MIKYLIVLLLFTAKVVFANSQYDTTQYKNEQQQSKALQSAECGRIYTDCQSQCAHVELVDYNNQFTQSNGSPVPCNPKNNRIAQCRNACYTQFTQCNRRY